MSEIQDIENRVRTFFRVKREQLLSMRDLPICEHAGLIGGHREELQRIYLQEVLPERFRIGRGMVYGPLHRSREADIVIWDAFNYPRLPMLDHSFFFAESVRLVIECKSTWSSNELADVLQKTKAVRDIIILSMPNLENCIQMLQLDVAALKTGQEHHGLIINRPHIGTAAIFLAGGQTLIQKFSDYIDIAEIDDSWPDVFLLLEPGYVVIKRYEAFSDPNMNGRGWLEFFNVGDDSLLIFTSELLSLVTDRVVQVEAPLNLWKYVHELARTQPEVRVDFELKRPAPQTKAIWE